MLAILVLSIPAIYFRITQGIAMSAYVATSSEYEAFWDARIPCIGLIIGIFFFSLANGKHLLAGVLASKPLAWAGKVSFGIYLLHLDIFEAFEKIERPGGIRFPLALAACRALAFILHRIGEAPIIDLGKRLSEKIARRPAAGSGHLFRFKLHDGLRADGAAFGSQQRVVHWQSDDAPLEHSPAVGFSKRWPSKM